ncbi:MAG TPA: DUF3089 domain-containing protein [Oligoflexus sp.]|uniref:DUF3089 domain-containing protein n=1 Tax=Oligoflexus sp. TaxID=1971216 RepID=UPI002D46C2D5|nr:DUF3089 domain-containing protein [Oligoflexus sp.]HYX33428.1 DUF3089 domain-containing protein [Oligoflexus sp.]
MNWRKWILPAVMLLLIAFGYSYRFQLFYLLITPIVDFDPDHLPPAPDYQDLKFWAMHPAKENLSDPAQGLQVFWIHPTTLRSPIRWNEAPGDIAATERFEWTRREQASLFLTCCRVFAPHYRQATLASFWQTKSGYQARSLAYSDVRRAFDQFLLDVNPGEPFVIAAHSQGTEHGLRLLHERIAGTPIQNQLLVAYLVGMPLHRESLDTFMPQIPICDRPEATGCLVGWSTLKETLNPENYRKHAVWPSESGYHSVAGDFVCVNPVSWKADGVGTSTDQHQGAHLRKHEGLKIKARCERGALLVDDVDANLMIAQNGNYHLDDYALFYYDIQKNVRTREAAYRDANKRP